MAEATTDGGRLGHEELGWTLGVLLRHHHDEVSQVLADVPQGHRGFHVLASVVHGDQRSLVATITGRRRLAQLEQDVRVAEDRALSTPASADRATLRHLLAAAACGIRQIATVGDPCEAVEQTLRPR